MPYTLLADLVVLLHGAVILFILFGGTLVLRWPRMAWLHLPFAAWGTAIEFFGFICPLTPLEKWLRDAAGERGYDGGFIDHYIIPLIYPPGLTRGMQILLGLLVLGLNLVIYILVLRRWRLRRGSTS